MQVAIRKIGNSRGVVIPKSILRQLGSPVALDMQVNGAVIELRPIHPNPRAGWAQDSARIASSGDDALVWPDTPDTAAYI